MGHSGGSLCPRCLGSYGADVGPLYDGADDFTVFSPREETGFVFEALKNDGTMIRKEGPFDGTLIDRSRHGPKRSFSSQEYYTYTGGNYGICTAVNMLNEGSEKVLLIRDTYACVLQPFMSMNYREVTAIDPRYYHGGTVKEYIEGHDPDAVILVTGPQTAFHEEFTEFALG